MEVKRLQGLHSIDFEGRLIIHVGSHKTGTTTVQDWLADHTALLADRGVLYPEAGRAPFAPSQHWSLGLAILEQDRDRLNRIITRMKEELAVKAYHTLFLSTEVLSRVAATADKLAIIGEIFPKASRHWLLVMRRQDELLPSQYAEHLKQGYIAWPEDYGKVMTREHLDHLLRLRHLIRATPEDPITIARFADMKPNLIPRFLTFAGLADLASCLDVTRSSAKADKATRKNTSPPPWSLAAIRYANALPSLLSRKARRGLLAAGRRFPRMFSANPIPPRIATEAMDTFADSNLFLEDEVFRDAPRLWTYEVPRDRQNPRYPTILEDHDIAAIKQRVIGWTGEEASADG